MLAVFDYFSDNRTNDYKLAAFKADWGKMTDKDKEDLKSGIANGTLNY